MFEKLGQLELGLFVCQQYRQKRELLEQKSARVALSYDENK